MYSVSMALVDFIPVILFAVAAVILQRDLYNKMPKGAYALFAAGTIDVILAGFLKALYKLLYALNVCDFERLNQMFFPVQALGLLLAGLGIFGAFILKCKKQNKVMSAAAVPAVFSGTFIFVAFMVIGLGFMNAGLSKIAVKMKKPLAVVLYILAFFLCLGMGYLSTKDVGTSSMNWIAEGINVVGQGSFFAATLILHKAGLADETV